MSFTNERIESFKKAAMIYRAVNNPVRLSILSELFNGPMSVTNLYVKLRMEQSVMSQHLAILRNARWVITKRDGKHVVYSINNEVVNMYNTITDRLIIHVFGNKKVTNFW